MHVTNVIPVISALLLAVILDAVAASPVPDDAAVRRLEKALKPLETLNQSQMIAVTALILAERSGFIIDQYCPPLKQFTPPPRMACSGEMVSYASAVRDCKKPSPTWKDCPKALEAEAQWSACTTKHLVGALDRLDSIRDKVNVQTPPKPTTVP
jgi:hypothetical protein